MLDTTYSVLTISNPTTGSMLVGPRYQALSKDGKYLFISGTESNMMTTVAQNTVTKQWYNTGKGVSVIQQPWTIRAAPDWDLLVVRHRDTTGFNSYISSYRIQPDGSLIYTDGKYTLHN